MATTAIVRFVLLLDRWWRAERAIATAGMRTEWGGTQSITLKVASKATSRLTGRR